MLRKRINLNKNLIKYTSVYNISIIKKILIKHSNDSMYNFFDYKELLKKYSNNIRGKKARVLSRNLKLLNIFKKNFFFQTTKIKWIRIGKDICINTHRIMSLIIGRKNLKFLFLDENFNLKPLRTLTTKERKKSRFSNTFHLCREILRLTKIITDSHIKFEIGGIGLIDLIDVIYYIFTHVGHLTAIYRYKYKILKQIKHCKHIDQIFKKINLQKRGKFYCGNWTPLWRVWVFFLRGIFPLLERWLSNLLVRFFNGRKNSKNRLYIKKQRIESYCDIQEKIELLNKIKNSNLIKKTSELTIVSNLANKAWKNWKSNHSNYVDKDYIHFTPFIDDYVKKKSHIWIRDAYLLRERISRGISVDKVSMKKNLGRLTRLWFKSEQKRQKEYIDHGPFLLKNQEQYLLALFSKWIESSGCRKINFPSFKERIELKLLNLCLETVKIDIDIVVGKNKLFNKQDVYLEKLFLSPLKTLKLFKEKILYQKVFLEIGINFLDNFKYLTPVYQIDIHDRITDSFIDHYIWLKASKNSIFPNWNKPVDDELNCFLVYKFKKQIDKLYDKEKNIMNQNLVVLKGKITNGLEKTELPFLNNILKNIMDFNLARFVTTRNNCKLVFKEMCHYNSVGLIKGLNFAGFLFQVYYLLIDIIFIGVKNIYNLMSKKNSYTNQNIKNFEIKFYFRYLSNNFFILDSKFFWKTRQETFDILISRITKKIPTFLARFELKIFYYMRKITDKTRLDHTIDICGYNLRVFEKGIHQDLKNKFSDKISKTSDLLINHHAIQNFEISIKKLLISSGSTTFLKISNKWNTILLGIMTYFRESCTVTKNFFESSCFFENKILNRIKMSFNSKMPSRFPPVLFYAPKELGGLGILSLASPLIPENDRKYSKFNFIFSNENIKKIQNFSIPSIKHYFSNWKTEFKLSKIVWTEFIQRRFFIIKKKRNLTIKDIDDLWDKGIPRINTLFQKNRNLLSFDYGWRLRMIMKKFNQIKKNPFWWTNFKHDGKLWCLKKYKRDVISKLGGIENILEHTLFKGTFHSSWEGLFWESGNDLNEIKKYKTYTNAQKTGLNQIPNRRFILWWSPTINRGNVYIGFQVQLDLCGIFMHGKIPTLKISFIQIFRGHLWQKIHDSIVIFFLSILDSNMNLFGIQTIQKEQSHPRKSYKTNSSSADIIAYSNKGWIFEKPTLISYFNSDSDFHLKMLSNIYWIDVQLRWGDFDSHDIDRYCRAKFFDFTSQLNSVYPSKTGSVISIDLAYNTISGYGFWIQNMKKFIVKNFIKLLKTNPALFILRERLRKSLQLISSENTGPKICTKNFQEIFRKKNVWIIDDKCFYRIAIQKSISENITAKPVNGCLLIFIPQTGNLLFKIITESFWKSEKKLSQVARWKASEEILKLITGFPDKEHPEEIISTRKTFADSLKVQLIQYPSILIKNSEIKYSLQSLIKIRKIKDLINNTRNSKNFIINLYDDWLKNISTFTAFSRLILLLRGIECDFSKVKILLKTDFEKKFSNYFWPDYDELEWIKIEIKLKNLILETFTKKNSIDYRKYTQNEIRDIIFNNKSSLKNDYLDILQNSNTNFKIHSFKDSMNRNIKVNIKTGSYDTNYVSISNWKFGSYLQMKKKISNFKVKVYFQKKPKKYLILPKNLVKLLANCFYVKLLGTGILLGNYFKKTSKNLTIKAIFFPNMNRNNSRISCQDGLYEIERLNFFNPVGIFRVNDNHNTDYINILKNSFLLASKYLANLILLKIDIRNSNCIIKPFLIKKNLKLNHKTKFCNSLKILITRNLFGFFIIEGNKKIFTKKVLRTSVADFLLVDLKNFSRFSKLQSRLE